MKKAKSSKFEPKIVVPSNVHNLKYYFAGLSFLALAKLKHTIKGYDTPRTFSITEINKGIEHDFRIVNQWLNFLKFYSKRTTVDSKNVLELGPGADLGTGIILLMKGVKKYNSLDVYNLDKLVPNNFYDGFFEYIENNCSYKRTGFLREQVKLTRAQKNDRLNYTWREDFDISTFKDANIDLIFSQAAFEHFDNVEEAISRLSQIGKKGSILIAEIDLKTHSRWIRDVDPLNIYRYPEVIYNLFKFRGSPNRVRPFQYEKLLKKYGWINIKIIPLTTLDKNYLKKVKNTLNCKFKQDFNQMECLSIMIGATKK